MSIYAVVYGEKHHQITYHDQLNLAIAELGQKHYAYMIGESDFDPHIVHLVLREHKYIQHGNIVTMDTLEAFLHQNQ